MSVSPTKGKIVLVPNVQYTAIGGSERPVGGFDILSEPTRDVFGQFSRVFILICSKPTFAHFLEWSKLFRDVSPCLLNLSLAS